MCGEQEVEGVKNLYGVIKESSPYSARFEFALSRFSDYFRRTSEWDGLLDLVIALEVLFASGSYRLSVRGSYFLEAGIIHMLSELVDEGHVYYPFHAHRVNHGEFPIAKPPEGKKSDFYFVERDDPEKALEVVKELCARRLPRVFQFNPLDDIQVMTPMHKGLAGVANLNAELQMLLNPAGKEVIRRGRCFRINNYEKEVFNGDIGRVVGIEHEEQKFTVKYEERVIDYD